MDLEWHTRQQKSNGVHSFIVIDSLTCNLKRLSGLRLHPLAIDVSNIGLEESGIVELWDDMLHGGSLPRKQTGQGWSLKSGAAERS